MSDLQSLLLSAALQNQPLIDPAKKVKPDDPDKVQIINDFYGHPGGFQIIISGKLYEYGDDKIDKYLDAVKSIAGTDGNVIKLEAKPSTTPDKEKQGGDIVMMVIVDIINSWKRDKFPEITIPAAIKLYHWL